MTPFELDILLWYYCNAEDHRAVINNVPIWPETRKWMMDEKLIEPALGEKRTYKLTERGIVYIEHLLTIKLPVQTCVMQWVSNNTTPK